MTWTMIEFGRHGRAVLTRLGSRSTKDHPASGTRADLAVRDRLLTAGVAAWVVTGVAPIDWPPTTSSHHLGPDGRDCGLKLRHG